MAGYTRLCTVCMAGYTRLCTVCMAGYTRLCTVCIPRYGWLHQAVYSLYGWLHQAVYSLYGWLHQAVYSLYSKIWLATIWRNFTRLCTVCIPRSGWPFWQEWLHFVFPFMVVYALWTAVYFWCCDMIVQVLGPYAPQGSTTLLPNLSVTSKVSAPTSYAWIGSWVRFRSSEDVTLLEFTSPVDREYMRHCQKFHWI